eukprot:2083152-Prymnesium_polylepis.1
MVVQIVVAAIGVVGAPRTDAVAKELFSWATATGVRTAPGYALGTFGDLSGVIAGERLESGDVIVELPRSSTLQARAVGDTVPA